MYLSEVVCMLVTFFMCICYPFMCICHHPNSNLYAYLCGFVTDFMKIFTTCMRISYLHIYLSRSLQGFVTIFMYVCVPIHVLDNTFEEICYYLHVNFLQTSCGFVTSFMWICDLLQGHMSVTNFRGICHKVICICHQIHIRKG